jgi:PhnB protein
MTANSICESYHSVTPYLIVRGGVEAINFYKQAFGAVEQMRLSRPDGKIAHAEIKIGDSNIMLADEHLRTEVESGRTLHLVSLSLYRSPQTLGGAGVSLLVYLDKVDDVFKRAIDSGATELEPVQNRFSGNRSGALQDPFGHQWILATFIEEGGAKGCAAEPRI